MAEETQLQENVTEAPAGSAEHASLLKALRAAVEAMMPYVDGVIALRCIGQGSAAHLFLPGDDLSDLTLWPQFPIPTPVRLIQSRYPDKTFGVVVRGCDERQLIELAKRRQINLDRLRLIGVACTSEQAAACQCDMPFPKEVVIGETVDGVPQTFLDEFMAKSREERLEFWKRAFSKCLKCYGCRNICPECFCKECILEESMWVTSGTIPPPFPMFHLIRAMHTVGKCVSCGECERACPADIPLTILYKLLRRDVEHAFGYFAGADPNEAPLMDSSIFLADMDLLRPSPR
jgi:formate dehydrogenase (coenzyme F420) beta subunit